MDLQALANLAQILGVLAILIGFVFAWEQVRHSREQRRIAMIAELMRAVQDAECTSAMTMVLALPEDCSVVSPIRAPTCMVKH